MAKSTPEQDRMVLIVIGAVALIAILIAIGRAGYQHQQDTFNRFLEKHHAAPMSDQIASLHCINSELHVLLALKDYQLHKVSPVVPCTAKQIEAVTEASKGLLWFFPMAFAFVIMIAIMAWGSFAMARYAKSQNSGN